MLHRKMSCESGLEKMGQNPSCQKSAMLSVLLGWFLPSLHLHRLQWWFCVFFNSRTLLNALSLLLLRHLLLTLCFCQNAQSWLSASPQAQPGSTRNHCAVVPAPESHTWVKTSAFYCCHLSLPALLAICSTTETQWIFRASSEPASVVCPLLKPMWIPRWSRKPYKDNKSTNLKKTLVPWLTSFSFLYFFPFSCRSSGTWTWKKRARRLQCMKQLCRFEGFKQTVSEGYRRC